MRKRVTHKASKTKGSKRKHEHEWFLYELFNDFTTKKKKINKVHKKCK